MAGGPGARIVDRVGVQVLPDVSKFLPSLSKYLERIKHQLRVEIPTSLDLDGITSDLAKVKAAADSLRVSVPVEYDEPQDQPRLPPARPYEIPVKADTDAFLTKAAADIRAAQSSLELNVPLTADGERLRREVSARVAAVQAQVRDMSVKVPIDPEMAARQKAELRAKIAELQAIARSNEVKIPVGVDEKGFGSAVARLRSAISNLNGSGMGLGALKFGGISSLGIVAMNAVPAVLTLASAVTQLSGFALLIPAAAGAATGAIGALVLGFKGFGEALSSVGDPEKFSKSLEGLAPNAREAATAIRDSLPAWKEMQQSVQNVLFDGFADSVRMLTTDLLPSLQVGLTANAEAMSGLGERFAAGIAQAGRLGQISAIFENSATALGNLRGAIVPVIDGLMTLGVAGSQWLPRLTSGAEDAARKFQEWASIKVENGDFDRWVRGAIDMLRQLADIGKSAASIIKSLMDAANASGASGLDTLQRALAAVASVVRGPEFQTGLTTFFEGIRAGSDGVMSALPAVGSALAALGQAIGPVAAVIGPVLGQALTMLAGAVQTAAPFVAQIATLLGQTLAESLRLLAPVLGPLIEQLGTALVTALQAIAPLIPQIISALLPLIPAIGQLLPPLGRLIAEVAPALVAFITAAVPLIQVLAQVVSVVAQAIDALLVPAMQQMAELARFSFGIAGEVAKAFQAIVTPILDAISAMLKGDFSGAWNIASQAVGSALSAAAGFVVSIGASILGGIVSMGSSVVSAVQSAWSSVTSAVGAGMSSALASVAGIGASIVAAIVSMGSSVVASAQAAWATMTNAIGAGMRTAQSVVVGAGAAITSSIVAMGASVVSAAQSAWSQFAAAVSTGASRAAAAAAAIPGAILGAIGNLGGLLYNAGQSVIGGLVNGIRSMLGSVQSAASEVAGAIRNFFPGSPVKEGPLVSWNNGGAGKRLAGLLVTGLDAGGVDVARAADRLASQVNIDGRASRLSTKLIFEGSASAPAAGGGVTFNFNGEMVGNPDDWMAAAERTVGQEMTIARIRRSL